MEQPPVITTLNAGVDPPAYDLSERRRRPGHTEGPHPATTPTTSGKLHKGWKDVADN